MNFQALSQAGMVNYVLGGAGGGRLSGSGLWWAYAVGEFVV